MLQYQVHCTAFRNDFTEAGWPQCAYTVSKVAVNAYTRILQAQLQCEHPRGKFFWHDLQIIEWDQGSLKGMWA